MQSIPQQSLDTSQIRGKRLLFVTGKIASPAVQTIVEKLSKEFSFAYEITVMPITVAALMTAKWIAKKLEISNDVDFVFVPGYLTDDVELLQKKFAAKLIVGPRDIRDLPEMFGRKVQREGYGDYSIEIIAEINYAHRLTIDELISEASRLVQDGADIIDLGCDPNSQWKDVGIAVRCLREKNFRCSIDTFDIWEANDATSHGAELVLSVNATNRNASVDWNAEVVVVPDADDDWMQSISRTVDFLTDKNVPFRIDPILEPIGCGFVNSLDRYAAVRKEFPEQRTLMGIGNITELTDVDSAGVNVILLAICQELGISSVLTTPVINWTRSSVAECNIARRLVHFAQSRNLPPKRIDPRLVMLRDPKLTNYPAEYLMQLSATIRDNNYRILIDNTQIHLVSSQTHISGTDPFAMMDELMALPQSANVDPSHAFYLGYELSKAATALQLGKRYEQDESLQWGHLTQDTKTHRLKRTYRRQADETK